MHYVYRLSSIDAPAITYIGYTTDLKARLKKHNQGGSSHTAEHKPWQIESYHAFKNESTARAFERYLKSGSGRTFAKRHF